MHILYFLLNFLYLYLCTSLDCKIDKEKDMQIDTNISKTDRTEISEGLSKVLADTFTLYLKTHKFHWNVTGPMFSALHATFEIQYNELWLATDLIAERIRALGSFSPGSYNEFSMLTSIKEAVDKIKELVEGHETVAKTIREAMTHAEKSGDEVTQDILTQRLTEHEKTAWMLRSNLE